MRLATRFGAAAIGFALAIGTAQAGHRQHYSKNAISCGYPRPAQWCGWYLRCARGIADQAFNVALHWLHYRHASTPRPGAVVVWNHGGGHGHVGELVRQVSGSTWIVRSGNDRGAVRTRPRSIANAVGFRA